MRQSGAGPQAFVAHAGRARMWTIMENIWRSVDGPGQRRVRGASELAFRSDDVTVTYQDQSFRDRSLRRSRFSKSPTIHPRCQTN
jgi:hypothetical protein